MTTNVVLIVVGVLIGMLIMGLIVWFTMPSLMLIKRKSNRSYDDTLSILSEGFPKKQDWHVLPITRKAQTHSMLWNESAV
jgi:hypothetical protein